MIFDRPEWCLKLTMKKGVPIGLSSGLSVYSFYRYHLSFSPEQPDTAAPALLLLFTH